MTIFKRKGNDIVITWEGWKHETPAILNKIFNIMLWLCGSWAFLQNALPFDVPEHILSTINRWAIFIPAVYKAITQFTHERPAIPGYNPNFNTEKKDQ